MVKVEYICKSCKTKNFLIPYWKDSPPDHHFNCNSCGCSISVKDDMAPAAQS